MAIAYNSIGSSFSDFATSLTYSFTNTAGDFMWALCGNDRSGSNTTINSITYNGAALTLATALNSGGRRTRMGYLIAPATGANNVVQTNSTTNTKPMSIATSYTGVHQTTPLRDQGGTAVQTINATVTDSTWTVVSEAGDLVVAGAIFISGGLAFTPGTDTTERINRDFTGVGSGFVCDEPGAASSVVINETHTSHPSAGYAFSLQPAAAGGGIVKQMLLHHGG